MEHKVIYRDNQELQAADLNNAQDWTQAAIDHVVLDTINVGKAYSGFAISKVAQTQIQTQPGRLYSAGQVYARDETVTLDFYNDLPVTTQRMFAITVWGQTITEDIQPRNFIIDADTGQAEPQSVAMETTRYCNVNYVRGIESADPQPPSIDANVLLVGYVTCDPTGVLSFEQSTATQVDNLSLVAARTSTLESWRGIISGAIDTLRTDLANLAASLANYTPLDDFLRLVDLVDVIYRRVFSPGVYIFYGQDNFLNEDESATGATVDGAYSATINEGLRFPGGGTGWTGPLQLLNPSEPLVVSEDGFTLPKPSGSRVRYDCSFPLLPWLELRILTFGFWNFNCRHLRPSRWRFRCGPHFTPCPPAQVWWYQGNHDPTTHILSFIAETWEEQFWREVAAHNENDVHWPRYGFDRWKYYWRDYVLLPHWAKVYTDFSHSANHIAHTFYNAQDGWLTGLTLFALRRTNKAFTLLISGCTEQGEPDHEGHTLRRVVLSDDDVSVCYDNPLHVGDIVEEIVVWRNEDGGRSGFRRYYKEIPLFAFPIRVNFPPVFLRAGQHFSYHVASTFDHYFAHCESDGPFQVHQGHFWHSDGTRLVAWLSSPRSLRFMLHFATWGRWGDQASPGGQLRYEVNLQPLQLAGGIGAIDVLAEHIIPAACNLSYEIQLGGVWRPFDIDPNTPSFSSNPALLPFRVVFTGTTDLMPGVSLTNSEVTLQRAAAGTFHHISNTITLGTPTDHIKVIGKLHGYVEAHHNCDLSIHYGATHKTADVVADEEMNDGTIQRTATFNVSAVDDFQVEIDGAQDGVGDAFFVSQRIAYAT